MGRSREEDLCHAVQRCRVLLAVQKVGMQQSGVADILRR